MRLFIIIFFLFINQSVFAVTNTRLALVIGNSKYENLGGLQNTINDARGVEKSLRELGFKTKLIIDANESTLRKALKGFSSESSSASLSLIFYAGHGAQINGENYLLPIDMEVPKTESDVQLSALKVDDVVNSLKSQTKIVFLDACRDNPALNKSLTKGRGGFRGGLAAAKNSSYNDSGSLFIAYATDSGSIAQDGDGQKNSPFTTALLKYIKQPVSIDDMFSMVTREVRLATKNTQRPYKYASLEGLVCLADKCGNGIQVKVDVSQVEIGSSEEIEFKIASSSNDLNLISNFLDKYPSHKSVDDLLYRLAIEEWGWKDLWVQYQISALHKAPIYIKPASIKLFKSRKIFETKWYLDKSTVPGMPDDYGFSTYSYSIDCEKKMGTMYQMRVFSKNGKMLIDNQTGDPRYIDLDTPISEDPRDIGFTTHKLICSPNFLRPLVTKNDLSDESWERIISVREGVDYLVNQKSIKKDGVFRDVLVKYLFKEPKVISKTIHVDKPWIPELVGYSNVPVVKSIVIKNRINCTNETFTVLKENYYDENDSYAGLRLFSP